MQTYTVKHQAGRQHIIYINGLVYQDQIKNKKEAMNIIWNLLFDSGSFNYQLSKRIGNC